MNEWNPDWLGAVLIVAWVFLVCGVLGTFDRKSIPVTKVVLDGKYRVAKRRVRVLAIHPGTHAVTLVLHDVDTNERAAITYHEKAVFKPRRFGP